MVKYNVNNIYSQFDKSEKNVNLTEFLIFFTALLPSESRYLP